MRDKELIQLFNQNKRQIALLIDPDKQSKPELLRLIDTATEAGVDYLFVGGSLLAEPIESVVEICKENSHLPVILFPGSAQQLTPLADAVLFLSLVSGRNSEFLIGQHIHAAPFLHKADIEVISTAYMLIDGGNTTSVEYMSNTKPIPADKTDIAVATALAAKYIGMSCVYLEAGSGAKHHVPTGMITEVKKNVALPLIIGGGIRNPQSAEKIFEAGADIIVLGSIAEENPQCLAEICATK